MPSGGRYLDQAVRRAARIRLSVGEEVRRARLGAGLSQESVGHAAHVSQSVVSRLEAGKLRSVSIETLVVVADAVGLDVTCRAYPGRKPTRDAAHAQKLHEFLRHVAPPLRYKVESALPARGDVPERRAWDALIAGPDGTTGVELEMRLYDAQNQTRRLLLKWRDSGADSLLLLVNNSAANRAVIRTFPDYFNELSKLRAASVYADLERGHRPTTGFVLL